jgi:hypothetical protein
LKELAHEVSFILVTKQFYTIFYIQNLCLKKFDNMLNWHFVICFSSYSCWLPFWYLQTSPYPHWQLYHHRFTQINANWACCQTFLNINSEYKKLCCIEYTSPWEVFKLTTLLVIGTDCTHTSLYHIQFIMMAIVISFLQHKK